MLEGETPNRKLPIARVKLFASVREVARAGEAQVNFDEGLEIRADKLRRRILEMYPELYSRGIVFVLAVNHKIVKDEARSIITPADEVAALPPISGG